MDLRFTLMQRKREIIILVLLVIIVVVLWYLAAGLTTPQVTYLKFSEPQVHPGEETTLIVEVQNVLSESVNNVEVRVEAESDLFILNQSSNASSVQKKQNVMGAGAHRFLEFPIKVLNHTTPGTYLFEVEVTSDQNPDNTRLKAMDSRLLQVMKEE